MVDKIFVKPDEVRGLGNIVSPSKTLEDFSAYGCSLSFEDDEYTMTYESNERVWVDTGSGSYNYGEAVDLSAHINTRVAGLTMQFFDGETLIGEATTDNNGEALTWITTLSAGVHIITAKCKGITSSNSARVTILLEYDGFEIIETSNKTILSAYDDDVAVFHVQLTLDGEPVAKQGVSVNWYKDNVLVSTKSTMSSGWCEFGYDAVGAGDITFRADVNVNGRLVSKIFSIIDGIYYNPTEVSRSTTNGSTIYDNDMSVALPTNCEISFDIWSNNSASSGEHRFFLLPKSQYSSGTTQPQYGLYIDQLGTSKGNIGKRQGNSSIGIFTGFTLATNTYHTVKLVKTGTSIQFYCDDDLKATESESWIDNYSDYTFSMMRWSTSGTSKLKNVLIKPL